jgi:putative ABC transport system substrate-binding protein
MGAVGLALAAGCGLWPPSSPEKLARVYRIGYVGPTTGPPAVHRALAELGYEEGRNLVIEHRVDRSDPRGYAYPAVEELVGLQVDLIVAANQASTLTASRRTETIPIVASGGGGGGVDLVASGVVPELARPGKNVTGLTNPPALPGKQLQLLTESVPNAARVGVLYRQPGQAGRVAELGSPARQLGVQLIALPVGDAGEIDGAFEAAVHERADAVFVVTSDVTGSVQRHVVDLGLGHRLPTAHEQRGWVVDGGLMYYGPDNTQLIRRAAYFVDRILRGAKPADLPVEQPRDFQFVINLKTAQALGLTIPEHVLLQASEVIQ